MSDLPKNYKLVPSLFDRLMDEAPARYFEATLEKSWSLAEMLEAIWRELALALEIKRERLDSVLAAREAAQRLQREAGLGRINAENFGAEKVQQSFERMLEPLVRKLEPRAWGVKTSVQNWQGETLLFTARILMHKAWTKAEIKERVRRDIEDLFNTRAAGSEHLPEELRECKHSLHTYGLPDLSSLGFQTEQERSALAEIFVASLRAFEPRLQGIQVTVGERDEHHHTLRLAIAGVLKINQMEDRVVFNTVFSPQSGECKIAEAA